MLFIFSVIFSFQGVTSPAENAPNLPQENTSIPELSYDYPDRVNAGTGFIFSIILKKASNYASPGTISCKFTGGMKPAVNIIENYDLSVFDNTIIIKWEKLSDSNIIPFSFPVSTTDMVNGVYPVKIEYLDETGLYISENVGVFIINTPKQPADAIARHDNDKPCSMTLKYPEEVLLDDEYILEIVVSKGKQTGAAKVFVQLPPASQIEVTETENAIYKSDSGKLYIELFSMPPSPQFSIRCKVKNTHPVKAVYPIRAIVELEDQTKITYSNFIFLTDKHLDIDANSLLDDEEKNLNSRVSENAESDSVFEALDKLLKIWTESTNARVVQEVKPNDRSSGHETPMGPLTKIVVFYSVQIVASEIELPHLENELLAGHVNNKLLVEYDGKLYRYFVGDFETMKEALTLKEYLSKTGFPDAFVVKYEDGIRTKSYF